MDTRSKTAPTPRFYEDFEPSSEWIRDDKSETLLIKLPGFKKEQIKVQIDSYRNLRTSGERPLDGNNSRWSRFRKEVHISENLNLTGIRAKFENETLHVIIPTLNMATPPEPQQQLTRAQEPPATTVAKPELVEATKEKEKEQPKIPRLNMATPPEIQQQPTIAQEPPSTTKAQSEPVEATNDKEKNEILHYNAEKIDDDQDGEKLFDKEKEAHTEKWRGGSSIGSRWLGRKAWSSGGQVQEIRRQVLMNAAVTMFLLLVLGIYLAYKAKRDIENGSY